MATAGLQDVPVAPVERHATGRRQHGRDETDDDRRGLILEFTGEVTRWISQTGYPISFPDLEGSSWCRHVLNGKALPGSLVQVCRPHFRRSRDQGFDRYQMRPPNGSRNRELPTTA